jgi:hypothetical protein
MQLVSGMKRGMGSQAAFVLAGQGVARVLNLFSGERRDSGLRDSHDKAALANERDRSGRGLDLDAPVVPAHLKGCPRLQAGLAADLFGDDQTPGRIYGSLHTINCTTQYARRQWGSRSVNSST